MLRRSNAPLRVLEVERVVEEAAGKMDADLNDEHCAKTECDSALTTGTGIVDSTDTDDERKRGERHENSRHDGLKKIVFAADFRGERRVEARYS